MGGSKKLAARDNFVKCNFTNVMLNYRRLASKVSKMFPFCFSDMFYLIQNIFCHNKNMTLVIMKTDFCVSQENVSSYNVC